MGPRYCLEVVGACLAQRYIRSLSSILQPGTIQTDKVLLNEHRTNKTYQLDTVDHEQQEELFGYEAQQDIAAELRVYSTLDDALSLTTVYR